LDVRGQDALKTELQDRAMEAATARGTQPFNKDTWSKWVSDHREQFQTAFRNGADDILPSKAEQLAHLIQMMKREGATGPTPTTPLKEAMKWVGEKTLTTGLGALFGGPAGAVAGFGGNVGGKAALANLRSKAMTSGELANFTRKAQPVKVTPLSDVSKTAADLATKKSGAPGGLASTILGQ
jgi:hypothetical protein